MTRMGICAASIMTMIYNYLTFSRETKTWVSFKFHFLTEYEIISDTETNDISTAELETDEI